MEKYRFWFEKPKDEEGISRDLEHNLYNEGLYQTAPQPQNMNTYDPWADWFNAGLDPEPFTDNFSTEAEQGDYFNYGVNPGYAPTEPGPTVPWQTVPWDQALNPLWFQEGQETQEQTGELPAGESGVQYRPDQDEGDGGWVASGISMIEETELKEETGLKEEEKAELQEETGLKVETDREEDPALKEENQLVEETIGEEETIDKEATIAQEKVMSKKETVNKEEAEDKTESISIEETRNEQTGKLGQGMIVWRNFPPKSL